MSLPERDWKHLSSVRVVALDRYCSKVLEEIRAIINDTADSAHDRYLRVYRLLQDRDAALASAFNDLRRSTAIPRLAAMVHLGVVSDEDLKGFTAQTRESAVFLSDLARPQRKTGRKS